jgi:hypothetical protein
MRRYALQQLLRASSGLLGREAGLGYARSLSVVSAMQLLGVYLVFNLFLLKMQSSLDNDAAS